MLNIKLWKAELRDHKVLVECDNEAVVSVLNSGRTHNDALLQVTREIAYVCAINSIWVKAVHVSTKNNVLCDCLSRWYQGADNRREFYRHTRAKNYIRRSVNSQMFNFTCKMVISDGRMQLKVSLSLL